jgi:nucleotide-binding universal stress UspA family protein
MSAPLASESAQRDLLVDMLFGAGSPLLLVPHEWRADSRVRLAIVAWDASRAAARAVHDALPLLRAAEAVEIACVQGEKDLGESALVELQQHLARHCKAVSAAILPHSGGGVAAALREHARRRDAHLLVMGAYGHSRLREFVLGGATREMLTHIATPTLMSH